MLPQRYLTVDFCIMRCNDKISDYQLCESAYHRIFAAGFKNFSGEKGAAGALVLYLFICVLKFMAGRPFIQPFILDTAYYRWKWIAAPRTVINYGLCVLIVIGLAYLPYRQDRKIR